MKSQGKHRTAGTTPRTGAAALMIGGLVAGTVATAGATTLKNPEASEAAAGVAQGDLAAAVQKQAQRAAGERASSASSMHSASLSELRDQSAADRSQARSAPKDAGDVSTVLESSTFTGHVLEPVVEVVEEPVAAEAEPAQTQEEPAQTQQEPARTQQEPAQTQQAAAPTQQQAPQQSAPKPTTPPAPAAGGSIVGIASQYVGYPYVLGGTPPSTFDCSSFTWWVYQQAGIDIPRSVAGQKAAVTPVSNPQPGDLVFTNQYYHVGIYAGNGMVVEALNAGSGVTYGAPVYGGIWYGRITG